MGKAGRPKEGPEEMAEFHVGQRVRQIEPKKTHEHRAAYRREKASDKNSVLRGTVIAIEDLSRVLLVDRPGLKRNFALKVQLDGVGVEFSNGSNWIAEEC